MKVVKVSGVKELEEDVNIWIVAGNGTQEKTEEDTKNLVEVLDDSLSIGMIISLRNALNEKVSLIHSLRSQAEFAAAAALALGILTPEELKELWES